MSKQTDFREAKQASKDGLFLFSIGDRLKVFSCAYCLRLESIKPFHKGYFRSLHEIFHTILLDTRNAEPFRMLKRDIKDIEKAKSLVKGKEFDPIKLNSMGVTSLKGFIKCFPSTIV